MGKKRKEEKNDKKPSRLRPDSPEVVLKIWLQKLSYYISDATQAISAVARASESMRLTKDLQIKDLQGQIKELKKKLKK